MDSKELFGETQEQIKEQIKEPGTETTAEQIPESVDETNAEQTSEPEICDTTSEQIQLQVATAAKKGNGRAAVAVLTVLFLLIIGLCVYIAVSLSKVIPVSGEKKDTEYEAQTEDPWEEILGDKYKGDEKTSDDTPEEETASEDLEKGWQDSDGDALFHDDAAHEYPNHAENEFAGPYYEETADCIDKNVSYEVKREFYDCLEEKENVNICISYIQIEGDIPGIDEINKALKDNTIFFAENYEQNKKDILEILEESGTGIDAQIKSFVTYNTEHMISVVVREDISMGYMYRDVALRCYNINLDTGTILDNTTILDLNEEFGQEFRERSNRQNGVSEGGIEPYSDDEIKAMLEDEDSLILFYTPLGMELGYNYRGDYYSGWITITMQDYENYLPTL